MALSLFDETTELLAAVEAAGVDYAIAGSDLADIARLQEMDR